MLPLKDKIGKLPKIKNSKETLKEILYIASDKRSHVLLLDQVHWLETKMKAIRLLVKKGLKNES